MSFSNANTAAEHMQEGGTSVAPGRVMRALFVVLLLSSSAFADVKPTAALRAGLNVSEASLIYTYDRMPHDVGLAIEAEGGVWLHRAFGMRAFASYWRYKVAPTYEEAAYTSTFSNVLLGGAIMLRPHRRAIVDGVAGWYTGEYSLRTGGDRHFFPLASGLMYGLRAAAVVHERDQLSVQLSIGLMLNPSDEYEDKMMFYVPVLLGIAWN